MVTQNTNIIIIGPVGAGKSTQGKLIAEALNKQLVSLDRVGDHYYRENGFGDSEYQKTENEKGFLVAYRLWWPSLAYAAQKVVKDYTDCVIDFGAGHSHYEDELLYQGVKKALAGCRHIILLLPAEDLDRSVSLLKERSISQRNTDWIFDGYDFFEHWVKDDCNHDLATVTVFTEGKTPEQTSQEIISRLELVKSKGPVKTPDESKLLYCSFCGKSQHDVRKLIAGPSVFICDECTDVCIGVILAEKSPGELGLPNLDSLIQAAKDKKS